MFAHQWAYWIVGVPAVVVLLLALRWLIVQSRTDRISKLRLDSDQHITSGGGRTSVTASALADAIADDAEAIPGVCKADAALSGSRDAPELWLTVTVESDADTGLVRRRLGDSVLADARYASEIPDVPAYLTLKVSKHRSERQVA